MRIVMAGWHSDWSVYGLLGSWQSQFYFAWSPTVESQTA